MQVQGHLDAAFQPSGAAAPPAADQAIAMDTDAPAALVVPAPPADSEVSALSAEEAAAAAVLKPKLDRIKDVLSGKTPIGLYLDFLYRCGGCGEPCAVSVGLASGERTGRCKV